ncbi:MAG: hypothetical protein ABGX12_00695, partial [Desulfurobacteriaceae bacterium]
MAPMGYFAGVRGFTIPTSLVPPVRTGNPIVAVGTSQKSASEPKLIFSFDDYVNAFGYSGEYEKHTLDEVADVAFKLYKVAPVVFISVGTDAGTVSSTDVINAISKWIDRIFFLFRLVPGILIAPKFSENPSVVIAMNAAMENITSLFKGIAVADIPDSVSLTDAPKHKNDNNLTDDKLILTYPSGEFNDKRHHLSVHYACLQTRIDAENEGIPYQVASNQRIYVEKASKLLTLDEANYLRGNGILTILNFIGGYKTWGDRTSAYPSSTDPVEAQIPIVRMFNFLNERFIRTYWSKVDLPLTPRFLKTVRDSMNTDLDGLVRRGYLLGGRVEIREEENPVTDLMDGIVRFHTFVTPPSAAREIDFYYEFDVGYIKELF